MTLIIYKKLVNEKDILCSGEMKFAQSEVGLAHKITKRVSSEFSFLPEIFCSTTNLPQGAALYGGGLSVTCNNLKPFLWARYPHFFLS